MENVLSIVGKYSTHEQEQTAQTALFTMKLLAKRLAEKHPSDFGTVGTLLEHSLSLLIIYIHYWNSKWFRA